MTALIDPVEFTNVTRLLRDFFDNRDFIEVHTQNRLSILAACEDPTTVATFDYSGQTWPLPQTGQMWLEYELLNNPKVEGVYCVSTSYRQEPDPVSGRHELIFPMFEFEAHGNFYDLIYLEKSLCAYLGYKQSDFATGKYMDVINRFRTHDQEVTDYHEKILCRENDGVFFLTHFPFYTSPFWNMRTMKERLKLGGKESMIPREEQGLVALKCDVLLNGMETIGSAERSSDVDEMREQFHTISKGLYSELLFEKFGKDSVTKELDEFLSHDFFPRFGGGIGITRLISAMRGLNGLTPGWRNR